MEKIAENIKKLRKQHRLSQQELADKIFVSHQTISGWESGRTDPDVDSIQKLAEIFGVSVEYLITGEDNVKEVVVEKEVPVEKVVEKEVVKDTLKDAEHVSNVARIGYSLVMILAMIGISIYIIIIKKPIFLILTLTVVIVFLAIMISKIADFKKQENKNSVKEKGDKNDEQI